MHATQTGKEEDSQAPADRQVLIVEDDAHTAGLVRAYLERDGHRVVTATDGVEGLRLARSENPRVVVLDVMLPGMDGMEICRTLRLESDVPIIMLTARVQESDRLTGLDDGADDYVTKPFSPRELAARIRAVLRRSERASDAAAPASEPALRHGEVDLDLDAGRATVGGQDVGLTVTELKLLAHMMRNAGRVLSRDNIIDRVLGHDYDGMDRTVDTHVSNLRRKLHGAAGERYIHTVYGMGYRFGDA